MLSIVRGAAFAFTEASIQNTHKIPTFTEIGNGFFLGVPWPIIFFFTVFLIFYFVLVAHNLWPLCACCRRQSGSRDLAGIPVRLVKMAGFVLTSVLASFSAIILLSRLKFRDRTASARVLNWRRSAQCLLGGTSL